MSYPGQEYWHAMNPNIRRAEEKWEGKVSLQDSEKNKRLHETIANLKRPELLAREWLIEWDKKHKLHPSQDTCVASLAALLAQPAVAEPPCPICKKPLSIGISWCKTCDFTHAVRCVECRPCGYINEGPCELGKRAHAAEQPKLTEGQARAITTAVLKVLSAGWRDIDDGFTEEGKRKFIKAVQEAALLTSPVAPPLIEDGNDPVRRDEFGKWVKALEAYPSAASDTRTLLVYKFAERIKERASYTFSGPVTPGEQQKENLMPVHCAKCGISHLSTQSCPKPPGEQPPQLIGQPLPVPASHGTQFGSDYQPLNAPEIVSVELPAAQERASDILEHMKLFANSPAATLACRQRVKDYADRLEPALATAAKQAREGAPEREVLKELLNWNLLDGSADASNWRGYWKPKIINALAAQPSPQTKG